MNSNNMLEPLLGSSDSAAVDIDEDIDVKEEQDRVLSGAADRAIIYLRNLRKVSAFLYCLDAVLFFLFFCDFAVINT